MTSINAIRFDQWSGAMMCDEQRHWNPERIKLYAADKIRSVIPAYIRQRYSLAACYGNTGTSSIGDELRLTICRQIEREFRKRCMETEREPESFLTVADVSRIAWRVICEMKHRHTDDHLLQKYRFRTADLVRGYTLKNGDRFDIKNSEIINDAMQSIARDPEKTKSGPVFGNAGILAGFDTIAGFQIYVFSMSEGFVEPNETGYAALGSGGDSTNFVMPRLFNQEGVRARTEGIDRVEGICTLIDAVNMASEHNLGVGGYFNMLLFDGRGAKDGERYREINDHRSKLASETVRADRAGFIPRSACREIVEGLLFLEKGVQWAEEILWESCNDAVSMHRLLRGYPLTAG
ncbi:hypothetical protein JXA40_12620 [bacterium]|nr:hypothetical protein [candidate division CSSED10-310 bacterium]